MHPYYTPDMPNVSGIYRITCIATGKIYIGSALCLRKRRKDHFFDLQRNKHRNFKLQRAWNKYGPDAFTFEVLELVLIPEMLVIREQYWLDILQPFGANGFNLDRIAGSSLGQKRSLESRKKMGMTQIGNTKNRGKKRSPEAIERHRLSLRGFKHSEETKRNMAKAHRGTKRSPETREKMRLAALGHTVSAETRAKISAANKRHKSSS